MKNDCPIPIKGVFWVGSTKDDLSEFPAEIKRVLGQALFEAQCGKMHEDAFPMKGDLREVTEICVDDDGDAYRAMYTAKMGDSIYALHAFKKKSTRGVATPKRHLNLVRQRLKEAKEHYATHTKQRRKRVG